MNRLSRRSLLGRVLSGTALAALVACSPVPASTGSSANPAPTTPPSTGAIPATAMPQVATGKGHLVAFDYAVNKVHVYALPEMNLTGSLDKVGFDNHLGTIVLPDGRVLFTSKDSGEVMLLKIDTAGKPVIDQRIKAELAEGGVWGQVDPTGKYVVISSGNADKQEVINVVDLQGGKNTVLPITMAEAEEPHPYITANPAWIYVAAGGENQSFKLDDVLKGQTAPASKVRVGLGSHGPAIAPALKKIFLTTNQGLEQISYAEDKLTVGTPIPWDANGRTTGRNARPRFSADGGYVYGAVAAVEPVGAEKWADRTVDIHIANLSNGTAKRLPLDKGAAPRFALSTAFALFGVTSPTGDAAYLFDVDAKSATFQSVVAKVALPALKNGPKPGGPTTGKEARSLAITPDGRFAFAAQGGDSAIVAIDTRSKSVVKTLDVPSTMAAGGYIVAVQSGQTLADLGAR